MIKSNFRSLSGVLFLTLIFLVFVVTTVCAEDQNLMYQYQTKLLGVAEGYTNGMDIAVDTAGNYYITGITDGNLDGQTKIGKTDAFIAKYDKNSNKQWTRLLGGSQDTIGNSVVLDNNGNCYITGITDGNLDGQTKIGKIDAFIAKYDKIGNKQWIKLLGVAKSETSGYKIVIDSAGNYYITGDTDGNLDGQTKTGNTDAFIAKYDKNGNKQWTKLLGVAGSSTYGTGIAIDSSDNCYITGHTTGNLDGQTKLGDIDAFIVKYDKNGNKQGKAKLFGVAKNSTYGIDVAIDSIGNCYITGEIYKDFMKDYVDAYIVKYDKDLKQETLKLFGEDKKYTTGTGIAIDSADNCYITGDTNGNLDGQTKIGKTDTFIVKYDKNLIKQGKAKLFGVAGKKTRGMSIVVDSTSNCYITGDTDGNLDGQVKIGIMDAFIISKVNP